MLSSRMSSTGTGFTTFHLHPPLNTVSLGICMDLNAQPPAVWDLALGPYEVADYCVSQRTNVLILLNAWLDSEEDPEDDTDWSTINYWALRLRPLWAKVVEEAGDAKGETRAHDGAADGAGIDSGSGRGSDSEVNLLHDRRKQGEELVVVVCNRCREENGRFCFRMLRSGILAKNGPNACCPLGA